MGSVVIDLLQQRSIAEKNIILKEAEEEVRQMEQQQQQAQLEAQQAATAAETEQNDKELQFKYDELATKERIEMAKLNKDVEVIQEPEDNGDEMNKFNQEMNLKRDIHNENVRHNKETEKISETKSNHAMVFS